MHAFTREQKPATQQAQLHTEGDSSLIVAMDFNAVAFSTWIFCSNSEGHAFVYAEFSFSAVICYFLYGIAVLLEGSAQKQQTRGEKQPSSSDSIFCLHPQITMHYSVAYLKLLW